MSVDPKAEKKWCAYGCGWCDHISGDCPEFHRDQEAMKKWEASRIRLSPPPVAPEPILTTMFVVASVAGLISFVILVLIVGGWWTP